VFSISYWLRTRDYMFIYIFYLVMRKNKGLYVYMCLLSRIAWEQRIVCLFISFISWCVRTRDYIFANIFYLVMRKNKGLYVYICLLSRDAWEQKIICLHILSISYCVRTRNYMFIYIFYFVMIACVYYLVMLENKGLYVYMCLVFRDA